ncbi:PKD domain-containing protein [Candidatus Bipolaricaulota bacterium]|nr:PKD domain-containing protein [Candidatus Bipolaricaulota bacterium]
MRVKSFLMWAIALAALVGHGALGAVGFTDQNLDAGYLNPGDVGIAVQQIQVQGDATKQVQFNAITVRNLGTATHDEITRIELWDGGAQIGFVDDPIGLSTGGVTIPVDYVLAAGATANIEVRVDVAGVTNISGGETLTLEVRFHYFLNGAAYTSAWIADGKTEEIKKAGFEEIEETVLDPGNYNPGDGAGSPVQRVAFTDRDANNAQIEVTQIKVRNLGTATDADIVQLSLIVHDDGVDHQADEADPADLALWNDGGVVFTPAALGWDGIVDDNATIEITVEIRVAPNPTDGRTVSTQVIIELVEQAQGYTQSSQAPTTQTLRNAGVEGIEEQSTAPDSGVLNPGESLAQTIEVHDNDVNGNQPWITRIWVQNQGTAEDGELESITVKVNGAIINTFNAFAGFATTGVWLNIAVQQLNDDGKLTVQILYRVGNIIPGHTLRPRVKVEAYEPAGTGPYETVAVDFPTAIELRDPGLEYVEDIGQDSATVYTGQRFCAQKIRLDDQDENDDGVTINPVVIKNLGSATGTDAGTDVVKIEVRTAAGDLLGETEDTAGFNTGGVTISTLQNNTVADDGQVELWIWVTIAAPEVADAGHTVKLQTTVFHQEDGATYQAQITSAATFTIAINHRPQVDFSWTPADPKWSDTITFTPDASDPDGDALVEFVWDFGDGTDPVVKTTAEAVTHQYPDGGTFTVTLTVTDARGLTGTKTKQITVQPRPNQPPTADFDWNPKPPEAGDVVTFTAEASDPDDPPDTPLTYAWDFGDGTTLPASEDNQVTHTYAAAGTYTVTLTVTDARGAETEVQKEITVAEAVNDPPQVTAIQITPASPEAKQEITFTATTVDPEGDAITSWEWDFDGDGTVDATTTTNTATHTYTASGFYTVKVRAKDGDGSGSFGPWYTKEFYVRGKGAAAIGTRLTQNPVATEAVIEFFVPEGAADIRLRVFDLLGRPVFDSTTPAGDRFRWDLTDGNGRAVPNGLYFYLITATLDGRTIRSEVGRILVLR